MAELTYLEAISDGLRTEMRRDESVFCLGEDIGAFGGGFSGGPFHSQNPEAWFLQAPGLKVVAPATAADAKGLLASAIRDPNPVCFLEHKGLYRHVRGEVPEGEYTVPIGEARVARE